MRYCVFIFFTFLISCKDNFQEFTLFDLNQVDAGCHDLGNGFSIPFDQIVGGGVSKDGIPSIDNPQFISIEQVDYLLEDELVLGVKIGDEVKVFPHRIMDKHEVLNGMINGKPLSVTFCPLTGTGIAWPRTSDTSYGVSGLLYNSNLIAYDRKTDSYVSQMFSSGISGKKMCENTGHIQVIETTWETWKSLYPDSEVLSTETGFTRNYGTLAYSTTQIESSVPLFPVNNVDERLPNYRRVFGIVINHDAKVFEINDFDENGELIFDFIHGMKVVVVGNSKKNFVVAFFPILKGKSISLEFKDQLLIDENENHYNLFGEVISGPDKGSRLESPMYFTGYWFAWVAFYPNLELYSRVSLSN